MSVIGALAVTGIIIAGVFWIFNNVRLKSDENKQIEKKDEE